MKDLPVWILIRELFLLFLNFPHQFFSLFILRCHNVTNTEVGQHNGRHIKDAVRTKANVYIYNEIKINSIFDL